MADTKISQLTSATLPLAGTEVLPIVQSSATVKVTTDNLTVKNVRSNATTGILQVAGPGTGTTRVMTVPNADFTAARTDAAQSFTGDQTLSTGNLVVGTAGKGIDFSADPHAAGMTSELLNDYEEGTWTPVVEGTTTAGVGTYTTQDGKYTKIGRLVTFNIRLTWSAHTGTGDMRITGLPFTVGASSGMTPVMPSAITVTGQVYGSIVTATTYINMVVINNGTLTFLAMDTAGSFFASGFYYT